MLIGMMLTLLERKKEEHPPLRVLFLCRQNSARSQMAAALLQAYSHGTIEAHSAGSQPAAQVHPFTLRLMERIGIDLRFTVPKSLEHVATLHFDAVITLCDQKQEICPVFPGDTQPVWWTFSDPLQATGSEEERYRVFEQTSLQLAFRIRLLKTVLERERRPFWSANGNKRGRASFSFPARLSE